MNDLAWENDRDFCCLNFKNVLSLLYARTYCVWTDLVEKNVGIGIGK
jgi:hypothetical protein